MKRLIFAVTTLFGTLHRRCPSFSCHDDMYEREYGQIRYGIDCDAGKPGEDGNDERDGRANAAMSKGDMKGACRELHASPENGCSKARCWHENVSSQHARWPQPAGFCLLKRLH